MQQGRGGGGGGGMPSASEQVVEEASPISSRPPAENLEEVMRFSAEEAVGSGGSSGNRWPREETLALLRIRSEMDSTFRDATVKGPLWEDVSRKLAELGYKRSAKKCKEKFENVHKYHKRTKEGKSGRQDGKTYKFFTQLEALNTAATPPPQPQSQPPPQSQQQLQSQSQPQPQSQLQPQQQAQTQSHPQPQSQSQSQSQLKLKLQSQPQSKTQTQVQPRPPAATLNVTPLSVGIPPPDHIQLSSQRIITNTPPSSSQPLSVLGMPTSSSYGQFRATTAAAVPTPVSFGFTSTTTAAAVPTDSSYGITFSSHSSSTASSSGFDDDEMEDIAGPSNVKSRKRKRRPARGGSRMMMELFENLMRRVMEKQESMQRSFLETIERRNRERINREEAWRRQESTRLAREDELMAQERSTTAARDAAIISLIQNITGRHTIHFPPPAPQAAAAAATTTTPPIHQPISSPLQKSQNQPATLMAIPEQGTASPSSRWPKSEVIALINLRSGLETKYQDSGAKAPLWEEISAGMKRMGYNRNAKRCKEKWENINKYYKKVKESSNKKRPEDAKTCPYFHQLDALYRNRVIGGTITLNTPHQHEQISLRMSNPSMENVKADEGFTANPRKETRVIAQMSGSGGRESKTGGEESGSLFGVGNQGAVKKPEDHLRVLMGQQGKILQEQQPLTMHDCDNIDEPHSYNLDLEEEDNDEEDEEEPDEDDNGKRNYKMEFQQRNTTNTPNREGNNGPSSFFTMVQ